MSEGRVFCAYPSAPPILGECIEAAIEIFNKSSGRPSIKSWKALDIFGHFISEKVTSTIDQAPLVIADISLLNANVVYEIGYAIGKNRPILLTRNKSLAEKEPFIRDVGIFDTLGYKEYENSSQLASFLKTVSDLKPLDLARPLNLKAPVYLLESRFKTDWMTRIVSRIKKARFTFRAYDPNESPRLSAYDAIAQVSQSYGVVIPLLSTDQDGSSIHNIRAAFLAGLAAGMDKVLCLMQNGDSPVPLDYRDFVEVAYHPADIDSHIADFAALVAEAFQAGSVELGSKERTFLQSLDLGASSAENEMRTLENYYLSTDQFLKSLRGDAHLVVGRKGSGKSAIFLQVRDTVREKDRARNVVLDLKPEGYKIIKFKEQVLSFLEDGTFQHTIMAFWEYVLLLEIAYKLLEKDKQRHLNDPRLYDAYCRLAALYRVEGHDVEGDFSERMSALMDKIRNEYATRHGAEHQVRLSSQQVTELLYRHDVRALEDHIVGYMSKKNTLWLLFDNIDKGWPSSGLEHNDLVIIRALLEATLKIRRKLHRAGDIEVYPVVFLRNDVYELLVQESSDRGKEAKVLLDWTDGDLLRELIRLRIVANGLSSQVDFQSAWLRTCVSHYRGEESSQYLIDRSLMRPRFLIDLINQCKSFAVNLGHSIIEEGDIEKGLGAFSTDILSDISYEISDIFPKARDVLYAFIGSSLLLAGSDIERLLKEHDLVGVDAERVFSLLLWHGFLGLSAGPEEPRYIYSFNYSMKLLRAVIHKEKDRVRYSINPAFWKALLVEA